MAFSVISGGFQLNPEQQRLVLEQRGITQQINQQFIQVGAVYLKTSNKNPYEDDWHQRKYLDTDLQSWIDNEDLRYHNAGFNLQQGWVDYDIDAHDPDFNRAIVAALDKVGVDTRFRFGRLSVGAPSHVFVQLSDEESPNFDDLVKFEPRPFKIGDKRYHVQIRSMATNSSEANVIKTAKQTVVPGSIYTHKERDGEPDFSVWFGRDNKPASKVQQIAATTPRKCSFTQLIRAITFGTMAHCLNEVWVEGNRQAAAQKVCGWLARVVRESQAMNNQEAVAKDVFCPIDSDEIAESLIEFVCEFFGDNEKHMRIRAYYDACEKLERNPDAKIPGWPAMETLVGGARVLALRTVLMPGSDVSNLTKMADRYLYDESDDNYLDRERFFSRSGYVHSGDQLMRRHKGDTIRVGGKPKEAFRIFEASDLRKRVGMRDLYPDLTPGGVYRVSVMGDVLTDEDDDKTALTVFNTWRGWPVSPPDRVDTKIVEEIEERLNRVLGWLTRDNPAQIDWIKQWLAYTLQRPGDKQQIAWVVVGEQGVGKSWVGNNLIRSMMGGMWGAASPKVLDGQFSVEPFIDKMLTFIDEAKFHTENSVEEIKKLVRNVETPGAEKFQSARTYRIFSRVMFASNRTDIGVGQANVRDRALFFTRTYDQEFTGMGEGQFRDWAESLKPWFIETTAFFERRDVREHLMYYMLKYPTDKLQIESIKHSSSSDALIVLNNMNYARRIAKAIIEEGRIFEDLDITYPFTLPDVNKKIAEVTMEMGLRNVQAARVMAEFEQAGVVERVAIGGQRKIRFTLKLGSLTDRFSAHIEAPMEPRFEFTESDYGPNECDGSTRPKWRGSKQGVVAEAKQY